MNDTLRPLNGIRILSLALNLPGPAALMRCCRMGATCVKLEPPAGDPMRGYNAAGYQELHDGVRVAAADLKTDAGQAQLHSELRHTDVLITSFRPSAIDKLGLGWSQLHTRYPRLSHVAIVGAPGARAEVPGHDLTYVAEHDLVGDLALPATLFADMGGALMASEAVLQAALLQASRCAGAVDDARSSGRYIEVALADAAAFLALPRRWGMTKPNGMVGGAHAGYQVYACRDGRVAVAALEPHFAASLCAAAGIARRDSAAMLEPGVRDAIGAFFAGKTRHELDQLAGAHDIPLLTLPA